MQLEDYLLEKKLISKEQLNTAKQAAGDSLIHYLAEKNLIPEHALNQSLAEIFQLPLHNLTTQNLAELPRDLLPADMIKRLKIIPLNETENDIEIATADPLAQSKFDTIRFYLNKKVKIKLAPYSQIKQITQQLSWQQSSKISTQRLKQETQASEQQDGPLIQFINEILRDAISKQATDIHFEPYENFYRVRFRIDGMLTDISHPPFEIAAQLSSRLKIMAKLDIAEKRLPQDGRCHFEQIDIRVNCCPTAHGEKIVLRLLDTQKRILSLEEIGLTAQQQAILCRAIEKPQGLILVTGPTGSGKTISLYAILHHLNQIQRNICSVEDPIEINLPGINQVNVQEKIGFSFAKALRAFLRQDPDVMMVGEIRDQETAKIAMRAAQTGHLVLATLHTNSTTETLTRLRQMDIPAYEIASSLSLVTAQRLLRKLCQHCHGKGCEHCTAGYHGRIAVHELLPMSKEISELIFKNASSMEIAALAKQQGMKNLAIQTNDLVEKKISSEQEAKRVMGVED